jgi:penicillin-binding protein 2
MVCVEAPDLAKRWLLPPGSVLKPFSLMALIQSGKLSDRDSVVCGRHLTLEGHYFHCAHPITDLPMTATRAIAYSCNSAVAQFTARLAPGELSVFLRRQGFSSATRLLSGAEALGNVAEVHTSEAQAVQALGAGHIEATPLSILRAYNHLAMMAADPLCAPVVQGLEDAVQWGTAQAVRMNSNTVAAKTGTVPLPGGSHAAICAGFAPSRQPQVVFAAVLRGRAGGSDAAPVAARILRSYFGERA